MNKLLTVVCGWGGLLLSSCMDVSVVNSDIQELQPQGTSRFDGTIYEYLQQGDPGLGITYDSLLYLMDYTDEDSPVKLKFAELKECLQDESGQYTFMAVPDSCFRYALQSLNDFRRLNDLVVDAGDFTDETSETEKYAAGGLTLEKLLNYCKEIERTDEKTEEKYTDIYIYKDRIDSLVCRYMFPGIYDTEALASVSSSEGKIVQDLHEYRMNLTYSRLPASGFVGGGPKDITFYDMRNTLEKSRWEPTKVLWTDIYAVNGVIHVLIPRHEFGFGQFIHYFKNVGHEK
ncbi:hypothetical protein [uncultured Bacteroides sp.]|jgi:hypothetical protein|uniref:hypothetical protein n=1 Tax=uncultured Bacteroides sp. TaxID=162156 RepID=UPI0026760BE8|nr:hypothetical protein [uncultured Bacteroides sp.]